MNTASTPTVLIVDDDRINVRILDTMLQKEGYQTLTAGDGEEAYQIARDKQPDLILLDIMMPDVDGFEACVDLRQDQLTTDIPVIFLSALADSESKVKAFNIGAVDYVCKPFQREEVLARTRLHLRLSLSNKLSIAESAAKYQQLRDAQRYKRA